MLKIFYLLSNVINLVESFSLIPFPQMLILPSGKCVEIINVVNFIYCFKYTRPILLYEQAYIIA